MNVESLLPRKSLVLELDGRKHLELRVSDARNPSSWTIPWKKGSINVPDRYREKSGRCLRLDLFVTNIDRSHRLRSRHSQGNLKFGTGWGRTHVLHKPPTHPSEGKGGNAGNTSSPTPSGAEHQARVRFEGERRSFRALEGQGTRGCQVSDVVERTPQGRTRASRGRAMAGCCSRRKRKEEETVDAEQTNRPKYNSFTQQDLPSCKLVLSPRLVILCLLVVCVVFIPIGVAMFVATQGVYEVSARYDNVCFDKNTQGPWYEYMIAQNWQCQTNCSIVLEVEEDMKAPVYVYYGLRNYFQNHRRYVKSLSYSQLQGGSYSLSECDPIEYVGGNTSLPIVPCGLTAWSNFNDTFQLETSINNSGFQTLEVSDQGIAWEADMKRVFGKVEPENFNTEEFKDYRGGAPIRTSYINQDERFMNWMRISTFSKFKKLWGKVNTDIVAGTTLRINITNCYNSYRIDGEKVFSLSTASWIGGKNDFLPITYLSIGSICGALSILFSILHLRSPRKMGDSRVLSWNKGK